MLRQLHHRFELQGSVQASLHQHCSHMCTGWNEALAETLNQVAAVAGEDVADRSLDEVQQLTKQAPSSSKEADQGTYIPNPKPSNPKLPVLLGALNLEAAVVWDVGRSSKSYHQLARRLADMYSGFFFRSLT